MSTVDFERTEEDYDYFPTDVIYYNGDSDTQSRKITKSNKLKEWPTSTAILFVQACVDYCKSTNRSHLDVNDESIDWDILIGNVKWPMAPKTAQTCIRKVKSMQHQWKSPGGSLAEGIREILRSDPQIFGPEAFRTRRTVPHEEDNSRKRHSPHSIELDEFETIPKRPKLDEIVRMLETTAQHTSSELELARRHLNNLLQQMEQLKTDIKLAEEDIEMKIAERRRANIILDAIHYPSK